MKKTTNKSALSFAILSIFTATANSATEQDANKDSTYQAQMLDFTKITKSGSRNNEDRAIACPSSFPIGSILQTRQVVQVVDVSGYYQRTDFSSWYEQSRDCRANRVEERTIACPANQQGEHKQQRYFQEMQTGGIIGLTNWQTVSNSCDYYRLRTETQNQTQACSAGQRGSGRTLSQTIEIWSDGSQRNPSGWALVSSDCHTPKTGISPDYAYIGGGAWGYFAGIAYDYSNNEFRCIIGTPRSGGPHQDHVGTDKKILNRGQSYSMDGTNVSAQCRLSNNNKTIDISANCARTSGGTNDFCITEKTEARILSVDACQTTIEIDGYLGNGQRANHRTFTENTCE